MKPAKNAPEINNTKNLPCYNIEANAQKISAFVSKFIESRVALEVVHVPLEGIRTFHAEIIFNSSDNFIGKGVIFKTKTGFLRSLCTILALVDRKVIAANKDLKSFQEFSND